MDRQHQSSNAGKKLVKIFCFVTFLAIALFSSFGCAGGQPAVKAGLGETFTMNMGQSAQINGEDLSLTFNEVIGDSRCPKNVQCIWAGVVSFRVTFVYKGTTYPVALKQSGLSDSAKDSFSEYKLTFNVMPYPESGKTITPKDYQLVMTITK